MANRDRDPADLTRDELIAFVSSARVMLYGDEDEGGPGWNPTMFVEPGDFLAWAREEMTRLGLVPHPGPRADEPRRAT